MSLRELAKAATPGPWEWDRQGNKDDSDREVDWAPAIVADGRLVVSAYNNHCCSFAIAPDITAADAAYIAAVSPDVVLALLDAIPDDPWVYKPDYDGLSEECYVCGAFENRGHPPEVIHKPDCAWVKARAFTERRVG